MRRLLAGLTVAALVGLAGCGFRPVYAPPGAHRFTGDVYVDIIPNRNGQLLRQALQEQLDGSQESPSHGYILTVAYGEPGQAIGMRHDNTTSRLQINAFAIWSLRKVAGGATITSGTEHALDGANLIDGQFFYSDLNGEAINERVATNLANEIVLKLASYFRAHPELDKQG
jgi:LPS-assembly lipoprotein